MLKSNKKVIYLNNFENFITIKIKHLTIIIKVDLEQNCLSCEAILLHMTIKTIKTVEQNCDPLIHLSYVDDLKILAKELNSEIKRAFDCSGGIR